MAKNFDLKFKFKKDRFRQVRGGSSVFYNIYCINCRTWLLLYQKDGPGNLYRLYLDRILAPENFTLLSSTIAGKNFQGITCSHCGSSIGVPMIYKKENRPAFRLIPNRIIKKKSVGTLPAPSIIEEKKRGVSDENSAS